MEIIADLQIHSRFSRAVSKEMTIPAISGWAKRKGIGLVATGDWTHPMWYREIERDLVETGDGFLSLASKDHAPDDPKFLLATEISCIYTHAGKGRRVHILVWVPSLASARAISQEMTKRGCNLMSDGRPITPLTARDVAQIAFTADERALVIPAHAWTPWFSLYGSMSGFDSIGEAFGEYADRIYAVETGLSSSPDMNWRIKELDKRTILSFSDAHSGPKLGREATIFAWDGDSAFSYDLLSAAIRPTGASEKSKVAARVLATIEFFPEEGKYHYSGHRSCGIRYDPGDALAKGTACPVCGKTMTQGVMQRVGELAGRTEADLSMTKTVGPILAGGADVRVQRSEAFPHRPPFVNLVPLLEIIAECIGSPVTSPKTRRVYDRLTDAFGNEFAVLLTTPVEAIAKEAGDRIAEGVRRVRMGEIHIDPGYDGVFGIVKIWKSDEEKPLVDTSRTQMSIF